MMKTMTPKQLRAASLVAPGTVGIDSPRRRAPSLPLSIALVPTTDDTLRTGIWRYEIDQAGNVTYFPVAAQKRQPWREAYTEIIDREKACRSEAAAGIL